VRVVTITAAVHDTFDLQRDIVSPAPSLRPNIETVFGRRRRLIEFDDIFRTALLKGFPFNRDYNRHRVVGSDGGGPETI